MNAVHIIGIARDQTLGFGTMTELTDALEGLQFSVSPDGKGVFVYHNMDAIAHVALPIVERWAYTLSRVTPDGQVGGTYITCHTAQEAREELDEITAEIDKCCQE